MGWILYRREDCSLCEHAVEALRGAGVHDYRQINIAWDGDLAQRYGAYIPVLVDEEETRRLDWPFDVWTVKKIMAEKT
jgi:hypothetical protein